MGVVHWTNLLGLATCLGAAVCAAGADPAAAAVASAQAAPVNLTSLRSPVLFRGDATTAYRDPAAIYHDGWFRLFFTVVKTEPDGNPFHYTATPPAVIPKRGTVSPRANGRVAGTSKTVAGTVSPHEASEQPSTASERVKRIAHEGIHHS